MTDELKPVRCGCGGEVKVYQYDNGYEYFSVECQKCGMDTGMLTTKEDAIRKWNTAMGERTAKVVTRPFYDRELHKCSNCQYYVDKSFTYCPGCGAKLEWE